ncbi:MAG: hypothetical protein HYZ53_13725 [Planctomycetes bacterium]|nr:hypothetical protein [Planctomycetota bacterium]
MCSRAVLGLRVLSALLLLSAAGCSTATPPPEEAPRSRVLVQTSGPVATAQAPGSATRVSTPAPAAASAAGSAPVGVAAPAPAGMGPAAAVRARAEAFLDALRRRDYRSLWGWYDESLRESGGSIEEFEKHMRKWEGRPGLAQAVGLGECRLEEPVVEGNRARVKVTLTVAGKGPEEHVLEWVRDEESSEWGFAGEPQGR